MKGVYEHESVASNMDCDWLNVLEETEWTIDAFERCQWNQHGLMRELPVTLRSTCLDEIKADGSLHSGDQGKTTGIEESRTSLPSLSILSNMVLNVLLAKPLSSRAF